jgi:hypothetical protein
MASILIKLPAEVRPPQGVDEEVPVSVEITDPLAARMLIVLLGLGEDVKVPDWWVHCSHLDFYTPSSWHELTPTN